jgi:hypothetical protein
VTWFEIYALFGAPLVAVAIGYALMRWSMHQGRRR